MLYEYTDIQAAAASLPHLQLNYRQLASGPLRATIEMHPIGEISSASVTVSTLVEGFGEVAPGRIHVTLCTGGEPENRYDHNSLAPGQIFIKGGSTPTSHQFLKPGFSAVMLNFPAQLLESHLGHSLPNALAQGAVLGFPSQAAQSLLELVRQAPSSSRHLSDLICTALCLGLKPASPAGPVLCHEKAYLAGAIRERLQDCPEMTLGDICAALFISERTLRRVFSEHYALSPCHYQLMLRLNRARNQLKVSMPGLDTVSEIAARQGFWHMGRFCAQYRRLFGEPPSHTLAAPQSFSTLRA